MEEQIQRLSLILSRIIWKNPQGSFGIGRAVDEEGQPISVTGPICRIGLGEKFEAWGRWEEHPQYGRQFKITPYEAPQNLALLKVLAGAGIKSGIMVEQAKQLSAGEASLAAFNPYFLLKIWPWLKWEEADRIALSDPERPVTDPRRIEAFLDWTLRNESLVEAAGSWLPTANVVGLAAAKLNVGQDVVAQHLAAGGESRDVRLSPVPQDCTSRVVILRAEDVVEDKTRGLKLGGGPKVFRTQDDELSRELSQEQFDACMLSCQTGISIIHGPPGTGKTRCLAEIARAHEHAEIPTYLCAPTGKAAYRIGELAARYGVSLWQSARTIHRLLRCQSIGGGRFSFLVNRENPIEGPACIIVDESSMIPVELMASLMEAVGSGSRLILIGDTNQIRPIDAGQPFADLIEAGAIPVSKLSRIWRNVEGSAIAEACRLVLAGEAHDLFAFLRSPEAEREITYQAIEDDVEIVRFAEAHANDPASDSIILGPLNRGAAGSERINQAVQARRWVDAAPIMKPSATQLFYCGDTVMQIRNDYQRAGSRGVFNGDIGRVAGPEKHKGSKGKMSVYFGDGLAEAYNAAQAARDLRLAYAISIHKSQGSEWQRVVLTIPKEASGFLTRQLLYTGMSRARQHLTIIAHPRAIQRALGVVVPKARTRLGCLLKG